MVRYSVEALKALAVVFSVFAVSLGCSDYRTQRVAASPLSPSAAPPSGTAMICVFRAHGLGTSVVAPVSDNGTIVGATEGSSYFCYHVEPGRHRIRTADAPQLALTVKAGRSYYLAHDLNVGRDTLIRITKGSAEALSVWCSEVEVHAAPDNVAVLKRGAVARADTPRPVHASADRSKQLPRNAPEQEGELAAETHR